MSRCKQCPQWNSSQVESKIHQTVRLPHRSVSRYTHADFEKASRLLESLDMNFIMNSNDIDCSSENWMVEFLRIMSECVPKAKLPNMSISPNWLSKDLVHSIQKRNYHYRLARRTGRPEHEAIYKKLCNKVVSIYIRGAHTTCIIEPSVWVLVVPHCMPVQSCREFFRDRIGTTQLLLLIYIDDISRTSISSGSLTLYADDLVLHRPVCSSSDYRLLQQDIDTKSPWTSTNYLSHNPTKHKYMVISRKQQPPIPTVSLKVNHSNSERVTTFKYLGVWISSDLSWTTHVSKVCKKTRRLIRLIYRHFYCYSSQDTLKQLCTSYIHLHLE